MSVVTKMSVDINTYFTSFQGPFDGVLGFSQGASMVSLLLGLQQQQPGTGSPSSTGFLFYNYILEKKYKVSLYWVLYVPGVLTRSNWEVK